MLFPLVVAASLVVLHTVFADEGMTPVAELVVTHCFAAVEAWPKELWRELTTF
jgi:hypothetical protein